MRDEHPWMPKLQGTRNELGILRHTAKLDLRNAILLLKLDLSQRARPFARGPSARARAHIARFATCQRSVPFATHGVRQTSTGGRTPPG